MTSLHGIYFVFIFGLGNITRKKLVIKICDVVRYGENVSENFQTLRSKFYRVIYSTYGIPISKVIFMPKKIFVHCIYYTLKEQKETQEKL